MDHGDQALREVLEMGLSARLGRRARIDEMTREPFNGATAYASDVLTVRSMGGDVFKVFVKDFRSSTLPKDEPVARCRRELGVYRELLADADLGTAGYYGSFETGTDGRHQLLIEFVHGIDLRSSEFPHWVQAAGWLARLHGSFVARTERLAACEFLVRHDAEFFTSRADSALRAMGEFSETLEARLRFLLHGYDHIVETMVDQPRTLVHGSYRPNNILVRAESTTRPIVPVDWELAAMGAPLYDLAFLADGFRPPDLDTLLDAYRRQADLEGLFVPDPEELHYLLGCFQLHKVMKSLSDSVLLGFSQKSVEKLMHTAEQLDQGLMTP